MLTDLIARKSSCKESPKVGAESSVPIISETSASNKMKGDCNLSQPNLIMIQDLNVQALQEKQVSCLCTPSYSHSTFCFS
jgi:hypothetical protein